MGKKTIKVGTKSYNLAEEKPLKGLKNGSVITLVAVAIDSKGEAFSDAELRALVNRTNEEGDEYPQYYCGYKNGVIPVIVPIGAIGRVFDGEEVTPNELTARLGEGFGYTELVKNGATLIANVRRGAYTFSGQSEPSMVRSISFSLKENGAPIAVTEEKKVEEFIALIKSARDYNPN